MALSKSTRRLVWWALLLCFMAPLVWLAGNWALLVDQSLDLGYLSQLGEHSLSANPIEYTNRFLGDWALRYLLVSLAVTPAARLSNIKQVIAYRRMSGLWAFAYVCLHLTSYIALDQFFDWSEIWNDVLKRNYITLGMIAFLLLLPMAVTSTRGWIKRLGARSWKKIHRAVYLIAPLGALHYFMMAKGNQLAPKIYIALVAFLLGSRAWLHIAGSRSTIRR